GSAPPPCAQMFSGRMTLYGQLEDLQDLAFIERPIRRSLKSAEEIDQLTVDEDLNDIERAVYLLSFGQEVQRVSVISNLPSLVRQNPAETFRRVVPKVRVGPRFHLFTVNMFLCQRVDTNKIKCRCKHGIPCKEDSWD
uniref:Protein phosphatase 4, regulatory subunit 4 n=1 Tax=Sphaeramia orbicularis TaxID=375764 RepID=A0A673AF96_9TELE